MGLEIALLIVSSYLLPAEKAQSAEHIRVMQEAHQREHARAIRTIRPDRPRVSMDHAPMVLTDKARVELKAALEQYVREQPSEVRLGS
jgi:hypothetical protein